MFICGQLQCAAAIAVPSGQDHVWIMIEKGTHISCVHDFIKGTACNDFSKISNSCGCIKHSCISSNHWLPIAVFTHFKVCHVCALLYLAIVVAFTAFCLHRNVPTTAAGMHAVTAVFSSFLFCLFTLLWVWHIVLHIHFIRDCSIFFHFFPFFF